MIVTIKNKPFEVASEPADYWGWIKEGRYDHEWAVYDQHLKPEHTFIDLGAWVGAHSLYAGTIAKGVIAVEPDPVAYPILLTNGVIAFRQAVGPVGVVKMGSGWLGASTTRANPLAGSGIGPWAEDQTFETNSETLREFVKEVDGPLFIKCDVEGSEEEILKDDYFFAERKPIMLLELHPFWWKDEAQTWRDFETVKAMYKAAYEVPHKNSKTWVLTND